MILQSYDQLRNLDNFRFFPSLRFEYFISLLKNADFIIGNSSCILKEALYLNIPSILIGTRQNGRLGSEEVVKIDAKYEQILHSINTIHKKHDANLVKLEILDSSKVFFEYLANGVFFKIKKQKIFRDIKKI